MASQCIVSRSPPFLIPCGPLTRTFDAYTTQQYYNALSVNLTGGRLVLWLSLGEGSTPASTASGYYGNDTQHYCVSGVLRSGLYVNMFR